MLSYLLFLNRYLRFCLQVAEVHATGDTCIPDILQMRKFFLPPQESFKEWMECNFTNTKFISSFLSIADIPLQK